MTDVDLALNHHRFAVYSHGPEHEANAVVEHAPEHFFRALHALAAHAHATGTMPAHLVPHMQLLGHPKALLAEKRDLTQRGSGFGTFLANLGKSIFSPILSLGKAIFGHPAAKEAASAIASHALSAAKDAAQAKIAQAAQARLAAKNKALLEASGH